MFDSLNVRPYSNKDILLLPPAIGDYLPPDDLAHVVDEAVEQIDLSSYYRKIPEVGNPSYHPALMLKIWFYGYATRTYSSRKIEEKLSRDIAFIYLAGMQKPDFKTIAEFRRKHVEELKESFVDILQICHSLGLTKLGVISLDSKVMKANAAGSRTYDELGLIKERERIEKAVAEYLKRAEERDCVEDGKYGFDRRGDELPEEIRRKEDRIRKMRETVERLKLAQEELKRSGKRKINLTDRDGHFQKDKGKLTLGYRAQLAVDAEKQIIVAYDVASDPSDGPQLMPMVEQIVERVEPLRANGGSSLSEQPLKLLADSGYSSGHNLAALEEKKEIDPYIPDRNYQAKSQGHRTVEDGAFHFSKFSFNSQGNYFICPQGKELGFVKEVEHQGKPCSLYHCRECLFCPEFGKCTKDHNGRSIKVSCYNPLMERMREKLKRKESRKLYALRKMTVETAIGNLSQNLGFREFLLRGTVKVRGECALMYTVHNLCKIAKHLKEKRLGLKEALFTAHEATLNTT